MNSLCADIKPEANWFQIFDKNKNFSLDLKNFESCMKSLKMLIMFLI